jgi:hypothetical protein
MNSTIYRMISIIGFTMSGIMLLVTVILFVRFKIRKLIGKLSGRTARKEIQEISKQAALYKSGPLKTRNMTEAYIAKGIFQSKPVPKQSGENGNECQAGEEDEEIQALANTERLDDWKTVPIKNADAEFEIVKDEILVHTEDISKTELLR